MPSKALFHAALHTLLLNANYGATHVPRVHAVTPPPPLITALHVCSSVQEQGAAVPPPQVSVVGPGGIVGPTPCLR